MWEVGADCKKRERWSLERSAMYVLLGEGSMRTLSGCEKESTSVNSTACSAKRERSELEGLLGGRLLRLETERRSL